MPLYHHQRQALRGLLSWLETNNRALVAMATGVGKTIVAAHYAAAQKIHGRGLFICHDNNILEQDLEEFRKMLGNSFTYGIFHGQRKDFEEVDILFVSFQTFREWKNAFFPDEFYYIIVDEAHHSEANTFKPVVEYFRPQKLLGLTAVPDRMDGRDIREIFGNEVINITLEEAIINEWLSRVEYHFLTDHLNTARLRRIMRESGKGKRHISIKQLNETIFIRRRDEEIAEIIQKYNLKTIVFCENIDHAENFSRHLPDSKTLHCGHPNGQNKQTLSEFRSNQLQYVLAVNKLNEGIDVPDAELIVFLRCTDSRTIFLEQLGRGLRKIPGKKKVIILDFAGNCERVIMVQQMVEEVARLANEKFELDKRCLKIKGDSFDFIFTDTLKDIIELVRRVQRKLYISEIPELAAEYMPPSRNLLPADQVVAGTRAKLWWKCHTCGYEWQAHGYSRVGMGTGCPACAGKVITSTNNLTKTHPHLAAEYMPPPKNLLPADQIIAGTNKKLWWKCKKCRHEWRASGSDRVRGRGCPACANKVVTSNNNLAKTHPHLAAEYMPHPKNPLPANQIVAVTHKKLWWKCSKCGHEWRTSGSSRVHKGRGCPACANEVVTSNNNLAKTHPHLAAEYMPPPKNKLPADQIMAGTGKKVWWKCSKCGHEWQVSGNSRTGGAKITGCPACTKRGSKSIKKT
ncbi:MAG: zinc-ribbon domain-containing protein [bacterium]|nr:zinc-ribbon domain-containing protein [bacterium]